MTKTGKALVCATEDWFLLSHFGSLLRTVSEVVNEVVAVTRVERKQEAIEKLGARVVDFDYRRKSLNPLQVLATSMRMRRVLQTEDADIVHFIAVKAITAGCIASLLLPRRRIVLHFTGLGLPAISKSLLVRVLRTGLARAVQLLIDRGDVWVICENPEDVVEIERWGIRPRRKATVIGGAGIDARRFRRLPPPVNDEPAAAFAGRMIVPKGVDVLVAAARIVHADGMALQVRLYGEPDPGNRDALSAADLRAWDSLPNVACLGHVSDVRKVWAESDIAVVPSRSREGLPRAMVEAAACGRPLVVTDVPGCRHFVRDGVEGFVVPPDDPVALAGALKKLAADPALRQRMGEAARSRIFDGFTEDQVQRAIRQLYAAALGADPGFVESVS